MNTSRTVFRTFTGGRSLLSRIMGYMPHLRLARYRGGLSRGLGRCLSLSLAISLLATSTPAAPKVISDTAGDWGSGVAFWFNASGWANTLRQAFSGQERPRRQAQEKQEARDARVSRVQIYPGDLTITEGERVAFAAVAYDRDDVPVGGVKFNWDGADEGRGRPIHIAQNGEFKATAVGVFKVRVEGAGKRGQVKVTVLEGSRRGRDDKPEKSKEVSTRDLPSRAVSRAVGSRGEPRSARAVRRHAGGVQFVNASYAHAAEPAAMPLPQVNAEYDSGNYWSADDPGNRLGDPPGTSPDSGAVSGNFQITTPVLSSPGRGTDVSLNLTYNSRVWNKADSQLTYDIDKDWPAPGWSLGFGKMMSMGMNNGSLLIDADGTRHSFSGSVTFYTYGNYRYFDGYTTDGTFINYSHWGNTTNGLLSGSALLANGTTVEYGAPGQGAIYPTRITDANGNYTTITYVNNSGPQIATVTDTLGRVINFHYDGYGLLTAVTAPGLNGGGARTLVRLHYRTLNLAAYSNYGFNGAVYPVVRNSSPWLIDAIYYPGTSNGYWFGDGDSYSSYGMISKVVEQRGMGFYAASLDEQGTVSAGSMTQQRNYDYPLTPDYNLTDAPRYGSITHKWTVDGVNVDQAVTGYSITKDYEKYTTTVTLPDGSKNIQYSYNHPNQYDDGMLYLEETRDAGGNLLQSSSSTWEAGAYSSPRPTRTATTDSRGQTKATEFSYGAAYNQVTEARDKGYANELLRSTRTQYENSPNYTNRHIFNLVKVQEVFGPDNATRLSRTEYQYDGQTLTDTPGVVMHSDASNPYAPQYWVEGSCYYDCPDYCYYTCDPGYWQTDYNPSTDYRGNVTQVKRYADAATLNEATAVVSNRRFDIDGNTVTASTSCCQETRFNYSQATQYGYALSQSAGSATDAQARVTTSTTYDFNTGLILSTTGGDGRVAQNTYYADSLRPQTKYLPSASPGAAGYTSFVYEDAALKATVTTYTAGAAVAEQNIKLLNGVGQVRLEKSSGEGGWDVVETKYDGFGRVSQQSEPYREGAEQPKWTTNTYDALGQLTVVQSPEGASQTFYNEADGLRPRAAAAGAQGESVRTVDAWGRERWARMDSNGRVVEVVEPNPSGTGVIATLNNGLDPSGDLVTSYTYDALGNLTGVTQGSQTRLFRYDSLGRMTHQRLAEASPTLDDNGTYVGAGTWSDVFTYDDRSNLTSRTDARGVKTKYNYNDALNRLLSIEYDTSGFGDTGNPILSAPTVSFGYATSGDLTRLASINIAGVGTETYSYNGEGRINSKTVSLNSRPGSPFVTSYLYDTLGRVTDTYYPKEYGVAGEPVKRAQLSFDAAGRAAGLKVDGADYASQVSYSAGSQIASLKVGTAGNNQITESYTYNQQTGLLENQSVVRGGSTTLLNLSYDYLRPQTGSGRTGQVTKITNNLDTTGGHDRSYSYDALGRLTQAGGGPSNAPLWTQSYAYDRYGNRTSVAASGNTAGTQAPSCLPSQTLSTEQYVRNFYQGALGRQPTAAELQSWTDQLRQSYFQGQAQQLSTARYMGRQVFRSSEYAARNRSNQDYVYDLYWSYLQRAPDQGGWDFWTGQVAANGRDAVRQGFEFSTEFANKVSTLCPRGSGASSPIPSDGLASLTYSPQTNRVTTPGFSYDAAGNQTRVVRADGSGQRYQYDAASRLVKVKDDYGYTLATYTYGNGNERLISQDGDENSNYRTYYVWEGQQVIAEYSESDYSPTAPQWSKSYVYLDDRLLATLSPNGGAESVQYYHPDRLGTRLITNSADTAVQEQVTLPFGGALDGESTGATRRRFTSYDRSPMTSLDYALNRHYDAAQGRFTQVDPLGVKAANVSDPQSFNMYAYCGNDPVNRTDRTGLFWGAIKRFFKKLAKILYAVVVVLLATVRIRVTVGGADGGQRIRVGFYFVPPTNLCGARVPTDDDGKAVVQTILGEATSLGLVNKNEYALDQGGDKFYNDHRNARGQKIFPSRLYEEKLLLAAMIFNRLNSGRWRARTLKGIVSGGEFYGYGAGAALLVSYQSFPPGTDQCEQLRDVIDAYKETDRGHIYDSRVLFNVAVRRSNGKVRKWLADDLYRRGDTDFSDKEFGNR